MAICDVLDGLFSFLDGAGAFNIPYLGDILLRILEMLLSAFNCPA